MGRMRVHMLVYWWADFALGGGGSCAFFCGGEDWKGDCKVLILMELDVLDGWWYEGCFGGLYGD